MRNSKGMPKICLSMVKGNLVMTKKEVYNIDNPCIEIIDIIDSNQLTVDTNESTFDGYNTA